jgi:hypothetical protein
VTELYVESINEKSKLIHKVFRMKQIVDRYQGICGLLAIIYHPTGKLRARPNTHRKVGRMIEELQVIPQGG